MIFSFLSLRRGVRVKSLDPDFYLLSVELKTPDATLKLSAQKMQPVAQWHSI
ncbi:MAG: hypothetical protein ACI8W8_000875, partial [Rhodothermales bacterium]